MMCDHRTSREFSILRDKSFIGRKYGAFDQMDSRGENYMEFISCRSTGGAALERLQEIVAYHISEFLNHNYLGQEADQV